MRAEDGLRPYLQPGPARDGLLAHMDGHAFARHARHFDHPAKDAFRAMVARHLATADLAAAVDDPDGRTRYLIASSVTGHVAWINPNRPDRSTFYPSREGAHRHLARQQAQVGPDRWRALNLTITRTTPTPSRTAARAIQSTARGAGRPGRDR